MPESFESLIDCREYMDKALESPKGLKLTCTSAGMAKHQQVRFHRARRLDRQASLKIFEPSDPQYGKSVYDGLAFCRQGKELRIEKRSNPEFPVGVLRVDEL